MEESKMKKTNIIGIVCMLLLIGSVIAVSELSLSRLKATTKVGTQTISGYVNGESKGTIEAYCTHEETTYKIGETKYETAKYKVDKSRGLFYIYGKTPCVIGDKVIVETGNVNSELTLVKGRHHGNTVTTTVETPVIETNTDKLNKCKLEALNWFNENKDKHLAGFTYDLKVAKCEYDFDKAECEDKENHEWKLGRCREVRV
jgi:hypothetical protein